MAILKTTIDAATLKGLATEFAKQIGTDKGFKGYWPKTAAGVNFYTFVESFGYAASSLDQHKTKFGYIVAHCGYDQRPEAEQPKLVTPKGKRTINRPAVTKQATTPKIAKTVSTLSRADVDKLPVAVQLEIYRLANATGTAIR